MKNIALLTTLFISISLGSAQAKGLKGADDQQFKKAISAWLDDDDETSLPILSKLAKEGNVAARLTLSGIETTHIQSTTTYFKSLSRKEKKALMRAEGGLSGTPWVRVEAEKGNHFAKILQQTQAPEIHQGTVRKLIRYGEFETASRAISRMNSYGQQEEFLSLAKDKLVPNERRYLVWQSAAYKGNKRFLKEAKRALKAGDPSALMGIPNHKGNKELEHLQIAIYRGKIHSPYITTQQVGVLEKWLISSPIFFPISSLCNAECPAQAQACTAMTFRLIGGYGNVVSHDTPLEAVISQKNFINSKKSRNVLLRHILDRKKYIDVNDKPYFLTYVKPTYMEDIKSASSCLADKLVELDS